MTTPENELAERPLLGTSEPFEKNSVMTSKDGSTDSNPAKNSLITSKEESTDDWTHTSDSAISEACSLWTPTAIIAVVIFSVLAIFVWLSPLYYRHTSQLYRWTTDVFICVLLSPLTGLKFTVDEQKEGLHLFIPNILTVCHVACLILLFVTSLSTLFEERENKNIIKDLAHVSHFLILIIQTFQVYPIWTNHLKSKLTTAEKYVGFIIFMHYSCALVGSMLVSFVYLPDLNAMVIIMLKNPLKKDEQVCHMFLGVFLQAIIMCR